MGHDLKVNGQFVKGPLDERGRLESHYVVDDTHGCWLWTGRLSREGYGQFRMDNGRTHRAHRAAWIIYVGPLASEECVCHDCPGGDNPRCVNPSHMFIGTKAENGRDAGRKGRHAAGEKCRTAKLTNAQAEQIRQEYKGRGLGPSQTALARRYGVSQDTIHRAIRRRTYTR